MCEAESNRLAEGFDFPERETIYEHCYPLGRERHYEMKNRNYWVQIVSY
jgi:hypothetical protein